jgi:hypothetical protein
VYGAASTFIKIAGNNIIQSVGVEWRQIVERPINNFKIINPKIAAEKILKDLNSPETNMSSSDIYKPELFSLGYISLPKRQEQNYMQPVYIAAFKSVVPEWNRVIVIPATEKIYEPIHRTPQTTKSR